LRSSWYQSVWNCTPLIGTSAIYIAADTPARLWISDIDASFVVMNGSYHGVWSRRRADLAERDGETSVNNLPAKVATRLPDLEEENTHLVSSDDDVCVWNSVRIHLDVERSAGSTVNEWRALIGSTWRIVAEIFTSSEWGIKTRRRVGWKASVCSRTCRSQRI